MLGRRAGRGLPAIAAAALAMVLTAGTAHADLPDEELRRATDLYLFGTSLDEFAAIRADRPYDEQLDWSSDGCSWSPDEPLGHDFTRSCHRHDFGYRNYQDQGRFTEPNRLRIDDLFRADMYTQCDGDVTCQGVANVYYFAVRQFGDVATTTPEALARAHITTETAPSGEVVSLRATGRDGETVEFPVTG
ncbi:phospholipase [Halopolyspora algeriensis]|nr:phospholipase [Halopolyspora algeriensis]